jgi:hypothetical protein
MCSTLVPVSGIGNNEEHEAHDRFNTSLPGLQEPFTLTVLSLCRSLNISVAVVLINGVSAAGLLFVPSVPSVFIPVQSCLALFVVEID